MSTKVRDPNISEIDDHEMLPLLLYFVGLIVVTCLYNSWQREQRAKVQKLRISVDYTKSRQTRRYRNSSLFDVVVDQWSTDAVQETFHTFSDRFESYDDVTKAMEKAGLSRDCKMIMAIDFSASNEWQGRRTLHRHCLHDRLPKMSMNPYQQVITALGETLKSFTNSNIHAFGFGDVATTNDHVFSFFDSEETCTNFSQLLARYTEIARTVRMSGPTNYAPVIRRAIQLVRSTRHQYHVLVIVTDGQLPDEQDTVKALIDASHYPLSIIIVGVGDGPWDRMEEFDDLLPARRFDNLQFVDFNKSMGHTKISPIAQNKSRNKRNALAVFALHALMELPDQFKTIRNLKLM